VNMDKATIRACWVSATKNMRRVLACDLQVLL
jgi:hypothetical protein